MVWRGLANMLANRISEVLIMRVNMLEAKTKLSELVAKAEAGELVEIARNGEPVVRLVPVEKKSLPWGCLSHLGPLNEDWDSPETNAEIAKLMYGEE
jgi:prevent-host-death family protein